MTFGGFDISNTTGDPLIQTNLGGRTTVSSATISGRAAAGSVGASISGGTFSPIFNDTGSAITMSSVSELDFVISGPIPPGFNSIPVAVNLRLEGVASSSSIANPVFCHISYDISAVLAGAEVGRVRGSTDGGVFQNTFTGVTATINGANVSVIGDFTSPTVAIAVGPTTRQLTLVSSIGFGCGGSSGMVTFGADFSKAISLRTSGLAFVLPPGYTATSTRLVDNAFGDPFAPPPPTGISFVGTTLSTITCPAGLASVPGDVAINGNLLATGIFCGLLSSVGGSVGVSNNPTSSGIELSSLTSVGGAIDVSNNTNTSGVDLSSLTSVGGSVNVTNNGPCTSVLLGHLTSVTGDLNVHSCGIGAYSAGNAAAGGNTSLLTSGYTTISGMTALGSMALANQTVEAVMSAQIQASTFTAPVSFSFTRIDPAALPPVNGLAAGGGDAIVDPIAAYQITFGVPALNLPATLTFDVIVANLDPATRTALLAALSAGTATMATRSDTAGGVYQAFPICTGAAVPTPGGCVVVQPFWAIGQPLSGPPTIVRFSNVVGHFSTWAAAIVSPCAQSLSINPLSQSFPAAGGSGSVAVSALGGCGWTGVSNAPWVTVTSGSSGAGNGAVNYSVAANTGASRSGTLTIAGRNFTVNQDAPVTLASADLAIVKLALPIVRTGRNLTYLIGAANLGPGNASNVVITDPLPSGTTFVRAFFQPVGCTSSGGAVSCAPPSTGTPCLFANNAVTCNIGTLAPLGPGNLTGIGVLLEVNVTAPAGATIRNRATVSAANPDPGSSNNSGSSATVVVR